MNRKWQLVGLVLFIVAILSSVFSFVLSAGHPDEIRDARVTSAVIAAGLAVIGGVLAIAAYLSRDRTSKEKISISGREVIPPFLIAAGLLAIGNGIAWWNAVGSGGTRSIGVGAILIVLGAILLRRSRGTSKSV